MSIFSTKETQSDNFGKSGKALTCARCGQYKKCNTPRMGVTGKGAKRILLVADQVYRQEDKRGGHWQTAGGKQLVNLLQREHGLSVEKDCWTVAAVSCAIYKDEEPQDHIVECCRRRLMNTVKELKPRLVLLLGPVALRSYFSSRTTESMGMTKWRGFTIPDWEMGTWVAPTFSPVWVSKQEKFPEVNLIWQKDIEKALPLRMLVMPEYSNYLDKVEIVPNGKPLISLLKDVCRVKQLTSFDYETTGLKPHAKGHEIVSASLSINEKVAYSFMFPQGGTEWKLWRKFLRDAHIPKTAHNLKYEHAWSFVKCGVDVENWLWCSQQAAHILDNRKGITGLKFQALVNFGIMDYNSHISQYLRSEDAKDSNAFNQIKKLIKTEKGRTELLTYGGIDSLITFWLTIKQMSQIGVYE